MDRALRLSWQVGLWKQEGENTGSGCVWWDRCSLAYCSLEDITWERVTGLYIPRPLGFLPACISHWCCSHRVLLQCLPPSRCESSNLPLPSMPAWDCVRPFTSPRTWPGFQRCRHPSQAGHLMVGGEGRWARTCLQVLKQYIIVLLDYKISPSIANCEIGRI